MGWFDFEYPLRPRLPHSHNSRRRLRRPWQWTSRVMSFFMSQNLCFFRVSVLTKRSTAAGRRAGGRNYPSIFQPLPATPHGRGVDNPGFGRAVSIRGEFYLAPTRTSPVYPTNNPHKTYQSQTERGSARALGRGARLGTELSRRVETGADRRQQPLSTFIG